MPDSKFIKRGKKHNKAAIIIFAFTPIPKINIISGANTMIGTICEPINTGNIISNTFGNIRHNVITRKLNIIAMISPIAHSDKVMRVDKNNAL
jgi:hypothetical protein